LIYYKTLTLVYFPF